MTTKSAAEWPPCITAQACLPAMQVQGESNIRRHIIEKDLLEAIVQLPNNLFL